ncbi:DNA polymerase-3 subunit epsilon [Flavobacterium glaciei]|uniref:DNA polymerase-3 subunit epsilon n=1 Tax=Flavobacterium glaciei TaxID=386300 RepID=A0A562PUL3_9FLAO|nr:DNA polymerase-3 subunit epsilon [Flavobacterium glaciei]TWI48137.1 DNA polymerase-3 subunit epsilon [Flavobacterium glaciei]
MKNNFVAIDFETSYGHIPCSIGIVEFIDGKVVNEFYSLIKPIDLKFNPINSRINGIHLEDVFNEREFDQIWDEIEHFFVDRVIIAHNSSTDITVLEKTLNHYRIHKPNFDSYCTLNIAKSVLDIENYKLSTLAKYFNIKQEDYHNALEDAFVCGKIFIEMFDDFNNKVSRPLNSIKSLRSEVRNYKQYLQINDNSKIIKKSYVWNATDKLLGKTFVVSGVFEKFSRDDLKKAIEDNGGKVGSSISAKTDYVIAGDNMGPAKLDKANKLNISIISEDDFINLITKTNAVTE